MPLMQPRASPHGAISLRFNVHWTRASARPHSVQRTALPPGMILRAGRPDVYETLRGVIAGVRSAHWKSRRGGSSDGPSGVVIGSCGPAALIDDAVRAVGRVSWAEWKAVGGVESIEEYACFSILLVVTGHVLNEFRRQGVWVVKFIKFFLIFIRPRRCWTALTFWFSWVNKGRDPNYYSTIYKLGVAGPFTHHLYPVDGLYPEVVRDG